MKRIFLVLVGVIIIAFLVLVNVRISIQNKELKKMSTTLDALNNTVKTLQATPTVNQNDFDELYRLVWNMQSAFSDLYEKAHLKPYQQAIYMPVNKDNRINLYFPGPVEVNYQSAARMGQVVRIETPYGLQFWLEKGNDAKNCGLGGTPIMINGKNFLFAKEMTGGMESEGYEEYFSLPVSDICLQFTFHQMLARYCDGQPCPFDEQPYHTAWVDIMKTLKLE